MLMFPGERIRHHGTHNHLLTPVNRETGSQASVDAIVVPAARPVTNLDHALGLARALDCPVIVLCSGNATAERVLRRAPEAVRTITIDFGAPAVPEFETSGMLAGTRFQRHTDTSLKRNVGLAIARMVGWRRVVFLDDDMAVPNPMDLVIAASLLNSFAAVGLKNKGFPDNSVVCHAYRAVGEDQDSFIGSGALAVAADRVTSFFPSVYNEDWFFLLGDERLSPVTVAGTVTQRPFDPYVDPERAGSEEFGDSLAEGIFALLDGGGRIRDADERFWDQFLADRRRLITSVLTRIPALGRAGAEKARMTQALEAALDRLKLVTADVCVRYLKLWRRDRERWAAYLAGLPRAGVPEAAGRLGLTIASRR